MKRVLVMILAGGRGKRMDILCLGRPKSVLPFAGNFRVIDFSLSNCIHSGISNIAVLVDYQRSHMTRYLKQLHFLGAGNIGFHVLKPKAGAYEGTADAVYQNLEYVRKCNVDSVLVLAADHVYKMDYRKMLTFHERMGADVTISVISVPIEQAHRFGIVTADTDGRIVDFMEKPKVPPSNLASMGVYVFSRQVLAERLLEDAADATSCHDFGHAVIPRMVKRDKVFAYQFDGYWEDIGTVEAYYGANMALTGEVPSFSLDGDWHILTKETNLPPPAILPPATVSNSFISRGCLIKGEVKNSVLSPGVIVEEQATVRNSLIMANTIIGKHSVVDRCVLDEEVNIGQFCYIGFGSSLIPGDWDITVLGKGVTVPPYTIIGRNCKVLPNVAAADFITNVISSGTVFTKRR